MIESEYESTIVNKLEFLKSLTEVHGNVKELVSKDWIMAVIPEEKKEPMSKLVGQFYFGYWLKNKIAAKDKNCSLETMKIIEKRAQADLDGQMLEYNVYMDLKRNERENPLLELTVNEQSTEREPEPEKMGNMEALKTMLKINKGKE